jgi:hypothetical protein
LDSEEEEDNINEENIDSENTEESE